ncbi:uncharacterized protein LOC125232076 [Leguminivora glycinivorella]|uniref:uncharacterized protein LOC125232076 n=1 Tax=Leguminivora glycinivorella TaxID=1035111 RepID=UPI00200EB364|nr:uncharacterized protein LOC125232076 [Leguminivora glycinivorella]
MADTLESGSEGAGEAGEAATPHGIVKCVKLPLPENILAYLEKRELVRDDQIKPCNSLAEKVTSNYIIAKEIISNLCWQEKMLAKLVCSTWLSAVHTLEREQLSPADFVMDLHSCCSSRVGIEYKKSANFATEPLTVLTFANTAGFNITCKCKVICPIPCMPPCEKEHCLLDLVQRYVSAPKDCMLTVRAQYLSYMPLPQSITYEHAITRHMFIRSNPFIGGVYIPKLPDVEYHVINIKSKGDIKSDFYREIARISETRIFKGVIVYVTEKYLLHSVQDIVFLNYIKEVQPDVPYALGGCIVEDTMFEQSDLNHIVDQVNDGKDFITENLISIGLFSVPKGEDNKEKVDRYNFEVYSLIIDTSDWAKSRISSAITEFAGQVPRFEHSVAIKLSCLGRDQKHEVEQDYFRASFPQTRIAGCYGNGELGINHPPRQPDKTPNPAKRVRQDTGPHFGIMYSYSTVFMYIGWGKSSPPVEPSASLQKTRSKTQARFRTN